MELEKNDRKRDKAEDDQEFTKLKPKVRREGEQEDAGGEVGPVRWWDFGEPMDKDGVDVAIGGPELVNHLEERRYTSGLPRS